MTEDQAQKIIGPLFSSVKTLKRVYLERSNGHIVEIIRSSNPQTLNIYYT